MAYRNALKESQYTAPPSGRRFAAGQDYLTRLGEAKQSYDDWRMPNKATSKETLTSLDNPLRTQGQCPDFSQVRAFSQPLRCEQAGTQARGRAGIAPSIALRLHSSQATVTSFDRDALGRYAVVAQDQSRCRAWVPVLHCVRSERPIGSPILQGQGHCCCASGGDPGKMTTCALTNHLGSSVPYLLC